MEGIIKMNSKERDRLGVMERVKNWDIKLLEGAEILSLSYRQAKRVYARYKKEGAKGLVHKNRGRPSNRAIDSNIKDEAARIYAERYYDFGCVFAAEKLKGDGYELDHETLRRILIEKGLWTKKRHRRKYRKKRERKKHFGELVQMDGSHHDWFEGRSEKCCLMNMVDDATGKCFGQFDQEETTRVAMLTLCGWIKKYGIPKALYVDRKAVFYTYREPTKEEQLRGEKAFTNFSRACHKLGIDIIYANSPQAKGRVERKGGVHQDRLVKELRLNKIGGIDGANNFIEKKYFEEVNRKFSVLPADKADYHREVPTDLDLNTIFCSEETRHVNNDFTVNYYSKIFQIEKDNKTMPRARDKVIVSEWLDNSIHIMFKGKDLRYKEIDCKPIRNEVAKINIKPRKKYRPTLDHPWRKFYFGRRIDKIQIKTSSI